MDSTKRAAKSKKTRERTLQLMGCVTSFAMEKVQDEIISSFGCSQPPLTIQPITDNNMFLMDKEQSTVTLRKSTGIIESQVNDEEDVKDHRRITFCSTHAGLIITVVATCVVLILIGVVVVVAATLSSTLWNDRRHKIDFDISSANIQTRQLCGENVRMITIPYDRFDMCVSGTELVCDFSEPFAVTSNIPHSTCLTCTCWSSQTNAIPSAYYVLSNNNTDQKGLSIVLVSNSIMPSHCRFYLK